jgi:ornithine cyclodeaminase
MNKPHIPKNSIRIFNSDRIKALVPMSRAIELMGLAFKLLSDKSAFVPPRVVMTSQDESMSVFFKPAFLQQYNRMSIKILTQIHTDELVDTATIKGMIMLVDLKSGAVLSLTDGTCATALRTGAASGLATKLLSRPDSTCVAKPSSRQ